MASPSAPLWDEKPTLPGGGMTGENEALRLTSGEALSRPMQLGPTIRIPKLRTRSTSCCCNARPASPISAKPAVITTSDFTPAAAQSSTTSRTPRLGTATIARSVPGGSARADR